MNYLAIDIGGTFIKYAVITESAEIISKGKKPTDTENLDVFLDTLEEIYRDNILLTQRRPFSSTVLLQYHWDLPLNRPSANG